MVQISNTPVVRHLRSEPSRYILHWSAGKLARQGRGLSYWFLPLRASVAEVPCDDRELAFLFHGRSADLQEITVQGVITWRVVDPQLLASRIDFSIDLKTGKWNEQPLEQLADVLTNRAQQFSWQAIAEESVVALLERGTEEIRSRIRGGLSGSDELEKLGIEVVGVTVREIAPNSELERALRMPVQESIQSRADEATFRRRASAVEKERAIGENELQNQIELATRENDLIGQQGENEKRSARHRAEAERIATEASSENEKLAAETQAHTQRLAAEVKAAGIRLVEAASVESERERMAIYDDMPAHVLMGLAAREFAAKLERIEHLNVTPDMLGQLVGDLVKSGSSYLERAQPE